jgi:iron complex outermembrane receptor protein
MVLRPWVQNASNCVAPTAVVEKVVQWIAEQQQANPSLTNSNIQALSALCTPLNPIGNFGYTPGGLGYIQGILGPGVTYDPVTDAPNGGQGFNADLGGKQLPNSPHWTGNFGAQYTFFLPNNASLAMRGDYYRQSSSYARVYNTSIDRLKAWDNVNLSVTLDLPSSGWTWQLYVKNLMNKTPLTDAFVNSDDSNLTTNVFTLDPRIIGLSVRKEFF